MTPEECATIRSIARWVLPVLVGPKTAVTPAPRARTSLGDANVNEVWTRFMVEAVVVISEHWTNAKRVAGPIGTGQTLPDACAQALLSHSVTEFRGLCRARLGLRTSLERIAPESLTRTSSGFVHGNMSRQAVGPTQDQ